MPHDSYVDFRFDNTFARRMQGFYIDQNPDPAPQPRLAILNEPLARDLGLDPAALYDETGARIFSGALIPDGAQPLAMAYAGHQFGGFSPRLGDGRAVLLGEVIDRFGRRRDIQLKGSGRTPFARGGDGKAALGPMLREYVFSEAMYALGVPSTRSLAVATTGETVARERPLPGAVLARVAASHLRVGTFEFFAARGETAQLRRLADYAIARHYPEAAEAESPYLAFLEAVGAAQASLIARWMGVGFVHGVMNTDNMAISGETIDYGPCAFIDAYSPAAVFSSIDRQGRYAFGNQPAIAQWNLARLAESLLPLLGETDAAALEAANAMIVAWPERYAAAWLEVMRAKLGLSGEDSGDAALANGFLALLEARNADFTQSFRALSDSATGNDGPIRALTHDADFTQWAERWRARLAMGGRPGFQIAEAMERVNPVYIPRNHLVESALRAAEAEGDFSTLSSLLTVLARPFDARPGRDAYAQPAPADAPPHVTFCGT